MEKKYELTDITKKIIGDSIRFKETTIYRIMALKDFDSVKKGELGGWVESEDNLSHNGTCWIFSDAMVYGYAKIYDKAIIYGHAKVYGGSTLIRDCSVSDYAEVYDFSKITNSAHIKDNARVCGTSTIAGVSRIDGDAYIVTNNDYMTCGPIGNDIFNMVTFYKNENKEIYATIRGFTGTIDEFEKSLDDICEDEEEYINEYLNLIKFIKESWRDKNGGEKVRDN